MSDRPAPPPDPGDAGHPGVPSMEGGGIYIRWEGRLWQEQADGSYLVWNEETRRWQPSTTQPPPQPGETRDTKECPNCGKRVKATLRSCPFCEFGFEDRAARPSTPETVAPPLRQRREVPTGLVLVAVALVVIGAVAGFFLYQQALACNNWRSAVAEVTEARIDLQGLPPGTTEEELYQMNEDLLADRRPGGCE